MIKIKRPAGSEPAELRKDAAKELRSNRKNTEMAKILVSVSIRNFMSKTRSMRYFS